MIVAKRFFLILIFFMSGAHASEHANAADAWRILDGKQALMKMSQAMHRLNYEGTVAFLRDGRLEPMKYFHAAKKGHEQERLLSLNSPLREIVRDAGRVSCLFKSTRQTVVDHRPFERSFLIDMPDNLNELDGVYAITVIGEEDVAMLPAYVVAIQPKDRLRYARKLWLEKQRFLPLKQAVYSSDGEVLEQFVFTELAFKESLPFVEAKQVGADNPVQSVYPLQAEPFENAAFVIDRLPTGFRERFFTRRPLHNAAQPVDHLLISDGLALVSVYAEHNNAAAAAVPQKKLMTIGAVNVFSEALGDFELTVMGEVPADTVKLLAENIRLRDAKSPR